VRIPIKATAREPIKQAGYISATSATHAQSLLRNAAGPYIRVINGPVRLEIQLPVCPRKRTQVGHRLMSGLGNPGSRGTAWDQRARIRMALGDDGGPAWSRLPLRAACFSLRADNLLAEMLETISALEISAGPTDDAIAGGIRIPATVPALVSAAVHGVRIAPSARRRLVAIRRSPDWLPVYGGSPGSEPRAAGKFSLALVWIGGSPLRQCRRAGQSGCRDRDRAKKL